MAFEVIDPSSDTLAKNHFLSVTANILERYNKLLVDDTIELDSVTKILSQTTEAYSQYALLKNSVLDTDLSLVTELKNELDTLLVSVQSKLDNGDFVGRQGEPFTYDDFTPLQLDGLKVKGDAFIYDDFTPLQLDGLKLANVSDADDYEEGTWTPNFGGATVSGGSTSFKYLKIGNQVTIQIDMRAVSFEGGEGVLITGLPFVGDGTRYLGGITFYNVLFDQSIGVPNLVIDTSGTRLFMPQSRDSSSWNNLPNANLNGSAIYMHSVLTYFTN